MTNKKKKYYSAELINLLNHFSYEYFYMKEYITNQNALKQFFHQTNTIPNNITVSCMKNQFTITIKIKNTEITGKCQKIADRTYITIV